MKISVNKEACSGCHICELVCSLYHVRVMNPAKSAVRIQKDDLGTSVNTPVMCRQCKVMKCLDGEEVEEDSERTKFFWEHARAERCPFKALQTAEGWAFHCDLCGGRPQCVQFCTTGALQIRRRTHVPKRV